MKMNPRVFLIIVIFLFVCLLITSIPFSIVYIYLLRQGPLSLDEALEVEQLPPLYYPAINSNYGELDVTYYYRIEHVKITLDAYFLLKNTEGELVRVATLTTYRGIPGVSIKTTSKKVSIDLAYEGFGWVCEVPLSENRDDTFPETPYQSCLSWYTEGENRIADDYILFTIWSEEETRDFANSLIPANP